MFDCNLQQAVKVRRGLGRRCVSGRAVPGRHRARRTVEAAVENARAINAITMWDALSYRACLVSLLIGDLTAG
jgi:hypothetical protein